MEFFSLVVYETANGREVGRVNPAIVPDATPAPKWVAAAWEFGGESAANGERRYNPNRDERSDIAVYHPAGVWDAMDAADRTLARIAFMRGAEAERRVK